MIPIIFYSIEDTFGPSKTTSITEIPFYILRRFLPVNVLSLGINECVVNDLSITDRRYITHSDLRNRDLIGIISTIDLQNSYYFSSKS